MGIRGSRNPEHAQAVSAAGLGWVSQGWETQRPSERSEARMERLGWSPEPGPMS